MIDSVYEQLQPEELPGNSTPNMLLACGDWLFRGYWNGCYWKHHEQELIAYVPSPKLLIEGLKIYGLKIKRSGDF